MEAATLNCPMCGAPSSSDATQCGHCRARLATVACPSCFGMIFSGAKFCQHCGAKADRMGTTGGARRSCPQCRKDLKAVAVGATIVHECAGCEGLWLDVGTFNTVCADRARQADVISQIPAPAGASGGSMSADFRYVPCSVCGTLMNRVNFGHVSGVILDVCNAHGVWCERDELRRVVEFIRAGGLDRSRGRELERVQEERRLKEHFSTRPSIPFSETGTQAAPSSWFAAVVDTILSIIFR
jgi:Zn-finger nucleic acid-binding protein